MKDYVVLFSPEAENESVKAFLWYEEVQAGFGKAFQESLQFSIEVIRKNPTYHSFIYKSLRSCRMKRFPFNVIYRISDLNIQVIAVFHHSRNPKEWEKRI